MRFNNFFCKSLITYKNWFSFTLIIVFIINSNLVSAQSVKQNIKRNDSLTRLDLLVQPIFLFNNAFKLDVEIQLKKSKFSMIGGLEIYTGNTSTIYKHINNNGENTYDKINGFGINIASKYLIGKFNKTKVFYISPGLTYRSLNLKLKGPMYYSYIENDVEYIAYGPSQQNFHINSVLLYTQLGYKYKFSNFFSIDVYTGIGYKKVNSLPVLELERDYEENAYGYNYKGFLPLVGFKLGFKLR
jgi:hypothetical protein